MGGLDFYQWKCGGLREASYGRLKLVALVPLVSVLAPKGDSAHQCLISLIDPVLSPAVAIMDKKSPGSVATERVSRRKCLCV